VTDSVLFFGEPCQFADIVLRRIAAAGVRIAARVQPGSTNRPMPFELRQKANNATRLRGLPMARAVDRPVPVGAVDDFPVILINDHRSQAVVERLASFNAQTGVVCCYPMRLPRSIFSIPRSGSVNVHPSLLPWRRGPDPLFWTFCEGDPVGGVTVHIVDDGLDTGPILAQSRIEIPLGKPGDVLSRELAAIGGDLLVSVLERIGSGSFPEATLQTGEGSYESWPTEGDLRIDPSQWDAARLHHFCQGVLPFGYRPRLVKDGQIRFINRSRDLHQANRQENRSSELVSCRDGSILLELSAPLS
jgi:methionyl-tRNA formyltransferase